VAGAAAPQADNIKAKVTINPWVAKSIDRFGFILSSFRCNEGFRQIGVVSELYNGPDLLSVNNLCGFDYHIFDWKTLNLLYTFVNFHSAFSALLHTV
jgi:hypothetical protein